MTKSQIRELALANGFKLKKQPNGSMDLHPYVYDFVIDVLDSTRRYAISKVSSDNNADDYDWAIYELTRSIKESEL